MKALLAFSIAALLATGCHRNTRKDNDDTGEKIEETTEEAGDKVEDAAEEAGDKVEDATD